MEVLVWIGAGITAAGCAGILWTVLAVTRARREGLDDAALRARLQRIMPMNVGALFLSLLGLVMVVVGVILA